MSEKFSYSKLSTFDGCGFRYKLEYIDKHFIKIPAIATDFGTLVHFVEETIAKDIIANNHSKEFLEDDSICQKYINIFINGAENDEGNHVDGIKSIKEKFPKDFYIKDKSNLDYNDKANIYLNKGIYRLRDMIKANPDLKIIGVEMPFAVENDSYIFHGFIDRVLQDKNTGHFYIEDIKTWSKIKKEELTTPLQFVFYVKGIQSIYNINEEDLEKTISCDYDLPLVDDVETNGHYSAGTKGFVKRGIKKISKLLTQIKEEDFKPKPSAFCHWCVFSKTYPNQPQEAKYLCPYYSKWTRENKDMSVDFEWMGKENHEIILAEFIKQEIDNKDESNLSVSAALATEIPKIIFDGSKRRFYLWGGQ